MTGMTRIAAFLALLGVVFASALLLGSAIGPDAASDDGEEASEGHAMDESAAPAPAQPRGLAVSAEGVQLEIESTRLPAGREVDFAFRVVDADGAAVTDFEVEHERLMHLIIVRRDMTGYQHLHPEQRDDGTWHVPLRLREAGAYRVFADFQRDGRPVTLGGDVSAAGRFTPRELPAPSDRARTSAGYDVALRSNGAAVEFEVTRRGRPVTDIEPYLGARGHLVALRDGDLAYIHVHADEDRLAFDVEYPSADRYRLFLQFRHEGRIHTAEFTQEVRDAGGH
jgi:hypothetical protein